MERKIHRFKLLLMIIFISVGCSAIGLAQVKDTVSIKDMAGREVRVPAPVQKIVGIEAGALRILVYLDAAKMVAGVEDTERKDITKPYLMAHPELAKLPSIGPIHGGDAELIAARKPDVIFWTSAIRGSADNLQQKTGIPVVVLNYGDLDNQKSVFYEALRLTAKVLNKQSRAEQLIGYIEATIKNLGDRTKTAPKNEPVYVGGINYRGSHGITSTEPEYAPFRYVNAKNVAAGIALEHVFIEKEKLIQWNPAKIFIDTGSYHPVMNDLAAGSILAQSLRAVKNSQLYTVLPYNWYTTNFETVLANAFYIGKVLYPEQFKDINPAAKADEIYAQFVGKGVYAEMKKMYGGFRQIKIR